MPHSYVCNIVHYIFSTHERVPILRAEIRPRLWAYLGGIARENKMTPLAVGGDEDHGHALISLPATISMAKGIQLLKGGSSKWLNETFAFTEHFAWQEGYGGFGVDITGLDAIIAYIRGQEEHHRRQTFQEEYLAFLKHNHIEYDERYLWN